MPSLSCFFSQLCLHLVVPSVSCAFSQLCLPSVEDEVYGSHELWLFENEWKNVNNEKLVKNILETFVNTRERSPT